MSDILPVSTGVGFGKSRQDCNRMIINAAIVSYLAMISDEEI